MDKKETYLGDFPGKIRTKQGKQHRSNPYSTKNRKKNVNEHHDNVDQTSASAAAEQVGEMIPQITIDNFLDCISKACWCYNI